MTDFDNGGGDSADEFDIVAYQADGAVIGGKGFFQSLTPLKVEVSGGFVEEEEIGWVEEEAEEGEADFLAAAEDATLFGDVVGGEAEAAELGADDTFSGVGGGAFGNFED